MTTIVVVTAKELTSDDHRRLGLLDVETVMRPEKRLSLTEATHTASGKAIPYPFPSPGSASSWPVPPPPPPHAP